MNTVVNLNKEFINKLDELEKPSCLSISTIDLCQKVSSTLVHWSRRGPAFSIQIVNFLIELVGALHCFLHLTEFSHNYA